MVLDQTGIIILCEMKLLAFLNSNVRHPQRTNYDRQRGPNYERLLLTDKQLKEIYKITF
jgi:hypothetical protein